MPRDPDEGKTEPTDITYGNESVRDEFKSCKCDSLNATEPEFVDTLQTAGSLKPELNSSTNALIVSEERKKRIDEIEKTNATTLNREKGVTILQYPY